jgi:putative FmdB family regulatory protein
MPWAVSGRPRGACYTLKFGANDGGASVPLYEYECQKCGRHTDKIEPVNGPHLKKCPHCGGKVESVITAPAIKFKGSGWYVTDYAGKTALGETPEKSDTGKGGKDGGEKAESSDKSEKKESTKESAKESGGKSSAKDSKDGKAAKKK